MENQEINLSWTPEIEEVEELPEDEKFQVSLQNNSDRWGRTEAVIKTEEGETVETRQIQPSETEEFPVNQLTEGNYTLKAQAETPNGVKQSQKIDVEKNTPETYRLDIVTGEDGEESTIYQYDNFTHSKQRIQDQRSQWLNDAVKEGGDYNPLLDKLRDDKRLELQHVGDLYPNWEESEAQYGHWNLEAFQNENQFGTILSWLTGPIRDWQQKIEGGYPSTENDHMAATMEKAVNQIHPDAQTRSAFLKQPGTEVNHGTYIMYSPLENVEADSHWWFVDTLGGTETIQEASIDKYYNPYVEGYPADQDKLDYQDIKNAAFKGLRTLVAPGHGPEGYVTIGKLSITDQYLESFYGDGENEGWVQEDNEADPVVDTMEKAIDHDMENDDEYTVVYGTVEDPQIAVGDEALHQSIMEEDESFTVEDIETELESST